ncbi:MAG: MBL fold metallo-hydrolase [Granulosicoccus sp.]
MSDKLVFTLLGTGSSGGVPRVGNDWGKCDPNNPKNRRRRCAMLVERSRSDGMKTTVMIDAGADLREQLLAADVKLLDALLLTHSHADHIFGLDDVRQLAITHKSSIDVYMDEFTSSIVMSAFGYCFNQAVGSSYPAFCTEHRIEHHQAICLEGQGGIVEAMPIVAEHGDIQALGFKINNIIYLPDVKRVSDERSLEALDNADVLIVDALRRHPHPTHLNLEECLAFIERHKPAKAILTNMHSDMDYAELQGSLPDTIVPGYDGLSFEVLL